MKRVCHLSSAHAGLDVRIFHKECVSLASFGYETHLVILADHNDIEFASTKNVTVHPLPPRKGRLSRMLLQTWTCYQIARNLSADIYHIHDPELLPYGILLRRNGAKVIYDIHEDLSKDILTKDWIPLIFRKYLGELVFCFEKFLVRNFYAVVAATPFITNKFSSISDKVVNVNNYPILSEFNYFEGGAKKHREVVYLGGIAKIRGIHEMIDAVEQTFDVSLNLAGDFDEESLRERAMNQKGWSKVNELGFLSRAQVNEVLERSMVGLVTLHPTINYLDSLPVKMFEYMAAGLPVICSNFPLWENIVTERNCGIAVDPLEPKSIAAAVTHLVDNKEIAKEMGKNGRKSVKKYYNWANEEEKLIKFYSGL